MSYLLFSTNLSSINGIGPKFTSKLKKLGIETIQDLLYHFPTRYEDFSRISKISEIIPHEECTVQGIVKSIEIRRSWKRRMFIIEAIIEDDTGSIRAVWFNQTYIKNILKEDVSANFSGKLSVSKDGEYYFSNPTYEITNEFKRETKHTARIVPIYPETKGLTSKGIRYIIQPLLSKIKPPEEIIPKHILENEKLKNIKDALNSVHFPKKISDAISAKRRFVFEDLFLLQLFFLRERVKLNKKNSYQLKISIDEIKTILKTLPFELTISQKKCLWEIMKDLNKSKPMNRLLQGDVGSGKTIVAAISAVLAAHEGLQTAFMAPTEILASQHFKTIKKFFPEHEDGVALITSKNSEIFYGHGLSNKIKKSDLLKEIKSGAVKIIIGTHAILEKNIEFKSLALIIIDEQHRFGVMQRAALLSQKKEKTPHFLSMSATPIPRTLNLAIFGDLDLSIINELPKDRKLIITKIVLPIERNDCYKFIKKEILNGRQAFVVCPRIQLDKSESELTTNEKEKLQIKTVVEEHEKLSKEIFPDLKISMIHGKMKSEEKEKIMREFSENKTNILVATSVIEVGVDIPNATIMMIDGAERFGLAQLYQFKGRVGRGSHQSYCFLFSESSSKTTLYRLKSIETAKNGFELAEKDLKLRGPGEFVGTEQTGMPDIAMKALQNPEIVKKAREYAFSILDNDSAMKNYPLLKIRLDEFSKKIHKE